MTLEATSIIDDFFLDPIPTIDSPLAKQAYQSLPETRDSELDWQAFRENTIEKLIKGVQNPNQETFKALAKWMYTVNKGPDLETVLEA